jgi:large subunit ribosomal protein L21e
LSESEVGGCSSVLLEKMVIGKQVREKGKLKLSSYFKKIDDGDFVAINIDKGVVFPFPERLQGRSGRVVGERGDCKIVKLMDGKKEKVFIVHPVHLRRLKNGN